MIYVLDSSAVIAFFRSELGGGVVESILLTQPSTHMHAINLCAVFYDSIRHKSETYAGTVVDDVLKAGVITTTSTSRSGKK